MCLIKTSVINQNSSSRYPLRESLTQISRLAKESQVWLEFCSNREGEIA